MDNLESEGAAYFAGADSVFCCLGTTRKVSGTIVWRIAQIPAVHLKEGILQYIASTVREREGEGGVVKLMLPSNHAARLCW